MKKIVSIVFFTATIASSSVWLISTSKAQEEESGLSVYELLDLFSETLQTVRTRYVEPIDESELIKGAVQGMLTTLDPHSSYMSSEQMQATQEQSSGEFGGLGIEVTMENGWVKVVSPIDDTPAAKAGIQAGDYITELNGENVLGLTLDEAVKKMRGPVGSDILLTVVREGEEDPLEISITRAVITIASAEVRQEADALVVRIKTFNQQTLGNVTEGIKEHIEEVGNIDEFSGIILDLRNNPGGLLTTAIAVSDAFLDQGDIVSVRGRDVDSTQNYIAEQGDLAEGKPMIVLINGGSASASEIVAGALQDHKRAVVVGTKSFGKGSVQSIIDLGEDKGGLRLTTARYYTPSGRSIQAQGIVPDIQIKGANSPTAEVEEDLDLGLSESDLPGSLENDSIINSETDEERVVAMQEFIESLRRRDPQMAHAIDMLSAINAIENF